MEAGGTNKRLALGTNVLLDLAKGHEFAHQFRGFFKAAGYSMVIPPTVAFELIFAARHEPEPQRGLARKALAQVLDLGFLPLTLTQAQQVVVWQFAQAVRQSGLLPMMELDDSLILAETGLAQIPLLATSDCHLLDVDRDALAVVFIEVGLLPVRPIHPNRLLRLLQ